MKLAKRGLIIFVIIFGATVAAGQWAGIVDENLSKVQEINYESGMLIVDMKNDDMYIFTK